MSEQHPKLGKSKSQYSAAASPWVRQKLRQLIIHRQDQAVSSVCSFPTGLRELTPIPDLNVQHHHCNSALSQNYRTEQLRRTASEPLLKQKLRRSVTNKNSLHRNSSAPPTDCPSFPVSEHTLPSRQLHRGLLFCQYNTRLLQENERHLDSKIENIPMASPQHVYISHGQEAVVGAFPSPVQSVIILTNTGLQPPSVLTSPHTPVHPVHMVERQHRPLTRTQSQIFQRDRNAEPRMYRTFSSRRHKRACLTQMQSERRPEQRMNTGPPWPVMRIRSSPNFFMPGSAEPPSRTEERSTGLVFDSQMVKQPCTCGGSSRHPDHAGTVWSRLQESGLSGQCKWIPERKATVEEISAVPRESHAFPYGTNPLGRLQLTAARMAAGSVTELVLRVAQGELRNGFAIVKPQGLDSSRSEAMRCFSSVAIAAKQLQHRFSDKKILIVDWDVHHDNSVQDIFYKDPKVLYISLHHYDGFISGTGEPTEVGLDKGMGFNVNVAWSGGLDSPIGDAEYLAAFRSVVTPIAFEFSPDVVLVSSEFNAVDGHPASNGAYRVSAKCFGVLTQKLMNLARGRVVLALEGGHGLTAVCDAAEACINALLENKVESLSGDVLMTKPRADAVQSLRKVLHIHSKYWSSLKDAAHVLSQLSLQAERRYSTDSEAASALSTLSMTGPNRATLPQQSHSDSASNMQCRRALGGLFHRRVRNEPMEHDENEGAT